MLLKEYNLLSIYPKTKGTMETSILESLLIALTIS